MVLLHIENKRAQALRFVLHTATARTDVEREALREALDALEREMQSSLYQRWLLETTRRRVSTTLTPARRPARKPRRKRK
jgi:hypothetical protein